MNFCFINPSISKRPEIYGLAKHLPKKYNITILQPSNKMRSGEICLSENIHVKHIPSTFAQLSDAVVTLPFMSRWLEELLSLIRSKKCDLIHICDYEYLTAILPIFVKRKYYVPSTIVNDALIGVVDYFFGTPLIDLLAKSYTYVLGIKILKSYDKIVFLHSKLAQKSKELGLPRKKIEVIPNGVDTNEIFNWQRVCDPEKIKEKYRMERDEKIILYVGRLVRHKRVEIVVDIIKELLNRNLKVKGIIVGEGPRRSSLEKRTKLLGIDGSILFTGYIPEEEKIEFYTIADLFVLPTLSEGLPTVLLEAAAFGIPAVATNTGGVQEIIIHGKTGFLVNKQDYRQYANYSQLILRNNDLAKRMGEAAKKHIQDNFSWNTIAKKYEVVFENLL
ncbi:MAG: glycosyltransferase family 4 protein [Candidatus Methanomethyliaceae archaeon]